MPSLAKQFSKSQIEDALEYIIENNLVLQPSTVHDLVYKGLKFPPKEVVRWAAKLSKLKNQDNYSLSGGPNTNEPLEKLGFTIVAKNQDFFISLIEEYKNLLKLNGLKSEIYKWELIEKFKGRPNTNVTDFTTEMKEIDFSNLIYGIGKGAIKHLAEAKPIEYKKCFELLYNEDGSLAERVIDFNTQVANIYLTLVADLSSHNDERTIATFLTYHNPERYTFYKDSFYQILCKRINEKARTKGEKYSHYLSIVDDFINNYIKHDDALINLVDSNKTEGSYADPNFKLLAQDILYTILEKQNMTFSNLVDQIKNTLSDSDGQILKILTKKIESDKLNYWTKFGDEKNIINGAPAHYEIGQNKKTKEISVGLHFEDSSNNKKFKEIIGDELPQGLYWGDWYNAKSIFCEKTYFLDDDNLVADIIAQLLFIDKGIGEIVRVIIISKFEKTKEDYQKDRMMNFPKNQILYGPPGTGKTYYTIDKALEIIGINTAELNRKQIKAAYDRKVAEGQIVFTTFHQSMSYEDFVEGIKPVLDDDNKLLDDVNELDYEIKDGIFKLLCKTAESNTEVKQRGKATFTDVRFYKMSLGGKHRQDIHQYCIDNNVIGLGYGENKNFEEFKDLKEWKQFRDKFYQEYPEQVKESRYPIEAVFIFQKMKIGDIVIITKGNQIIDAIGKITSEYFWDDTNPTEYTQFRKVEWIAKNVNRSPELFLKKNIIHKTIYEFYDADINKEAFEKYFTGEADKHKNYVLIIDEINRGNVSAILGELITCLEDSKRLGNDEALNVTLPYSKKSFGVPNNVYIIGTMNTADRSVEALDTALRRRFIFEEIMPNSSLLSPQQMLLRLWMRNWTVDWENPKWIAEEKAICGLLGIQTLSSLSVQTKADLDKISLTEINTSIFDVFIAECSLNLQILLDTINKRIELLLDRDHQIGHSYLINVKSKEQLVDVFNNNIVPLLQEYFYGDYAKIGMVLGKGFFERPENNIGFASFYDNYDNEFEPKQPLYLKKLTLANLDEALAQMI